MKSFQNIFLVTVVKSIDASTLLWTLLNFFALIIEKVHCEVQRNIKTFVFFSTSKFAFPTCKSEYDLVGIRWLIFPLLAFPNHDPLIQGLQAYYSMGDIVAANCTSAVSYPIATLTWFINDEKVLVEDFLIKSEAC